QFDHFDISAVGSRAADLQPGRGQRFFIFTVELITVAVTLADLQLPINSVGECPRFDLAGPGAQAHGAAKLLYAAQLAQFVDHAVRRCGVKFARVGFRQSADVAGKFNAGSLHTQAYAEVGDFLLARIPDRNQHSLNAALPEPAGNKDAVVLSQLFFVCVSASF